MEKNLNWAVLGTGVIANEMAQALKAMGKTLYAVGNRTHEKAVTFAEKYQVAKVYDDFHEMFTDPDVDVIYITTPHNTHIGFVREALKNKKHVLCEKSITLNSLELEEALTLAKENDVIFAEAMTIWQVCTLFFHFLCHAGTFHPLVVLADGFVGRVLCLLDNLVGLFVCAA